MPAPKKVTDEQLLDAYAELGSVWKVGERFGIGGGSVHERLVKLGATRSRLFTEADRVRIMRDYDRHAAAGTLDSLGAEMGRPKTSICREARALGLTNKARAKPYLAVWKYMVADDAARIWDAFKRSRLNLGQFCKAKGYDDLGFSRKMVELFPDEWEHVIELKAAKQGWYRLGRQFEYRVRDDLREAGFFVTRSPGSKSPVDIVGIRTGEVVFVQCKRSGALGVVEWNELVDLAASVGATPLLASIASGGRGIDYQRLTGRKTGTKARQPMTPWRRR